MFASSSRLVFRSFHACNVRHASTLVIAEHVNGVLGEQTLSVVTAAGKIGSEVSVLVAGSNTDNVAKAVSAISGVSNVIHVNSTIADHVIAENMAAILHEIQGKKNFSHIFSCATNEGKNYLPRLAAKLDVALVSDALSIESEDTFTRPMYAGNAIATVQSSDTVKLVTIRPTCFEKAATEGGSAVVESYEISPDCDVKQSFWQSDEIAASDRPELTAAPIVIAGGRGMKNGENFGMLYEMADKLGAAVGASRAAVDAGYVANELQVGQTGKVVAPDLYLAVGISGAIQHLAGMKDSKTIVCINKDPEAPIFQVSDYGLEADLFKAVPEINSAL